jgi:hypothetical protein
VESLQNRDKPRPAKGLTAKPGRVLLVLPT